MGTDDVDARAHVGRARLNTLAWLGAGSSRRAALLVERCGRRPAATPAAAAAPAALRARAPAPRERGVLTLHGEAEERDRLEHLGLVAGEVRAGACEVSSGADFTAETVWGGAHGDVCTLRFEPPHRDRQPVAARLRRARIDSERHRPVNRAEARRGSAARDQHAPDQRWHARRRRLVSQTPSSAFRATRGRRSPCFEASTLAMARGHEEHALHRRMRRGAQT